MCVNIVYYITNLHVRNQIVSLIFLSYLFYLFIFYSFFYKFLFFFNLSVFLMIVKDKKLIWKKERSISLETFKRFNRMLRMAHSLTRMIYCIIISDKYKRYIKLDNNLSVFREAGVIDVASIRERFIYQRQFVEVRLLTTWIIICGSYRDLYDGLSLIFQNSTFVIEKNGSILFIILCTMYIHI